MSFGCPIQTYGNPSVRSWRAAFPGRQSCAGHRPGPAGAIALTRLVRRQFERHRMGRDPAALSRRLGGFQSGRARLASCEVTFMISAVSCCTICRGCPLAE